MATILQKPIAAAVLHISEKTPVGSALRTAEWAEMPQALRDRAQFSAGIESARVINRIQEGLVDILSHHRDEFGVIADRSKLIADINKLAEREGLLPPDPKLRGTIQDPTSERRAELIFTTQAGQAYGRANWLAGMDEDTLNAAPAQELVRVRDSKEKRPWIEIWRAAGGRVFPGDPPGGPLQDGLSGRCIALKTDPIWGRISRFGNPHPPFDFGSGVWVRDVLRGEAMRLGLVNLGQRMQPNADRFQERLESTLRDLSPVLRNVLKEHFGDQIEIDGDVVRWKGGVAEHEAAVENRRQRTGRVFSGSAEALGSVRPADDAPEAVAAGIPEAARAASVEISAVASGRKPLFHEDLSLWSAEDLARFAANLQKQLPQGIVARFQDGHLYVYNPDLIGRLADPSKPLWPQIVAHRDDGKWLGYGVNWHDAPFATVLIEDGNGNVVSGFGAPPDKAHLYGAARVQDWLQATGQKHTYNIFKRGGGA